MVEKYADGMMHGAAGTVSIKDMQKKIKEVALAYGATSVGINDLDSLAGGPPSTDLNHILGSARSAITFAVPYDADNIRAYLSKKDRHGHQRDQNHSNTMASGIAGQVASYLGQFGAEAVAVMSNSVYRAGNDVRYIEQQPDLSHRYLAIRSGLGWFGFSGNVLTPEHGPNVVFATAVSDVPLTADQPLAEEDNYCDECQACNASCPSGFFRFGKKDKVTVTMGGREFTYTERRDYARCTYVCAGYNGLAKNRRWSTWSPGRFPIPNDDKELKGAYRQAIPPFNRRPAPDGVTNKQPMVFGFGGRDLSTTCGNCALVCDPERAERDRRITSLQQGGVVVQHEDGSVEAMSASDAKDFLAAMPVERRQDFEFIEDGD
ncbi:MAG: epoxyqueuosine reductase [Alphaproteobacteria bacterium]|jgi:epoxyqueuosine reductase QueG|nr:epoxyqueuosine reductase [Alphaproteobacteria bacterium]MDP6253372.1 epoxyqueuosine reductase [Alphaproteobacteria bacterium]MDP7055498.1 epoxyqueuosine reductase [Alphaproteobacteria bacterium]MDP7227975.1 epoxyqueuosine reductase [Alphaproteobacteria bacterium]MDP7461692.1 epoxyqueuosine reductase [Alphaproteobacteria bacterium]|tara:strand:- start:2784 stop:3911 length:1128 start_codon:yes stop_codon:yes gene_type:complete